MRELHRKHVFEQLGADDKVFAMIWLDGASENMTLDTVQAMMPSKSSLAHLELHHTSFSKDIPRVNEKCQVEKHWYAEAKPKQYKVNKGTQNLQIQSWLAQWGKLAKCFHTVKDYEAEKGVKFDYVIRIRPDMMFARDLPPPSQMLAGNSAIGIPFGIGGKRGFNDHAVVCKMEACPAYFLPPDDYDACNGSFIKQFKYGLGVGHQGPAQNRIGYEKWDLINMNMKRPGRAMVYTLVRDRELDGRKACIVACGRMAPEYWKTCTKVGRQTCRGEKIAYSDLGEDGRIYFKYR
jgi:hypothetical protein